MKLPFTLRLVYHTARATVRAGLLAVLAWLIFVPATATEVTALGARDGTQYPAGLRTMRVARVVVAVAPPRTYDMIAMVVGPDISPLMIRLAMTQMAAGNVLPASTRQKPIGTIESDRDIPGPRFIQVD
ncbi:hypothetical protein MWU60_13400 [Yoonia sp. F2084L]|uniref:hypothetical protein n=1 Tax=Yoonia sp. F2084L TaxID=2926419 RepID=UPI001FF3042A|nr:hypothetical protein [Yoonia sp. F2084L]MCK0096571.1 hypothetical protein [Yoonia sp. F2084L]